MALPLIAPLASFASGLTAKGVLAGLAMNVGLPLAATAVMNAMDGSDRPVVDPMVDTEMELDSFGQRRRRYSPYGRI